MNKFNFEPVGWLGTENCQPKFISSAPCQIEEEIYGPFKPLHTADQLTEAYVAGKRDAIPEGWVLVPKEPVGAVLVRRESREGVMFYSNDMIPDPSTIKDRFELITVYAPKGEE